MDMSPGTHPLAMTSGPLSIASCIDSLATAGGTELNAVRLMSMGQSKGLTVNTAILLGVDDDTVPNPRGSNEDEERRILYVAMTRATDFCAVTFAQQRTGTTARVGSAGTGRRQRSRFLGGNPAIPSPIDGADYIERA